VFERSTSDFSTPFNPTYDATCTDLGNLSAGTARIWAISTVRMMYCGVAVAFLDWHIICNNYLQS
jgi:hypothetical protein